ncbi:MAG: TIGR00296 family protein [Asgard group archaeon]|nr:TIGR00296 family protein [Asgard group archaeon]
MSESFSIDDGKFLISLARKTILEYLSIKKIPEPPENTPEKLKQETGVFVTLNKIQNNGEKALRGCIGYATPVFPLVQAVIQAAKSAACNDPRFPAVSLEEMEDIVVEVTILTPPEQIDVKNPEDYLKEIEIGRDGLIIKKGSWNGLLLPQVPLEWNWDTEEFLDHTCNKAGLPGGCWKDPKTEVYKFSGVIYQEEKPEGKVIEGEY